MKKNTLKLKLILTAMCLFGALFVTSTASAWNHNVSTIKNLYFNHYGEVLVKFDSFSWSGCQGDWMEVNDYFDTAEKLERVTEILMAAYLTGKELYVRSNDCTGTTDRPDLIFIHFDYEI